MTQEKTRGADHLVAALIRAGVRHVFALSGNQIMPVFDAALGTDLRLHHTRHEGATGFMAEAYAQMTGEVGVAMVTAGGGLGNALTALISATYSQTPILLMSGDSPVSGDGTGAFQEMDQIGLTRPLTKASERITDPAQFPETVARLLSIARDGIPGPVHLSLPDDMLRIETPAPAPYPEVTLPATDLPSAATPDLDRLTTALDAAQKPLVILGPLLSETRYPGLAERLRHALAAPVFCVESPRGLNDPMLGRWKEALREADLVVSLGKPVDVTLGFGKTDNAPDARWHVVTPDERDAGIARRNLGERLDQLWSADPRAVAQALTEANPTADRAAWVDHVTTLIAAQVPEAADSARLDSASVCHAIQRVAQDSPNPVVIRDGGEFGQWAQALIRAPRMLTNGVSGVIGGGLCYALGARAADPTASVFTMMGDGTVGFHLPEFETALRENLPFVAVIGNDHRWNAEYLIQQRDYGSDRTHGCELSGARYDLAVAALGGFGAHVTRHEDLKPALRAALASGLPACVNVEIETIPAPKFP